MKKYRGKRVDNGEWVYGYLIGNDVIVGEIVEFTDEYFNCEWWCRVDPKTVGQSTGLTVKEGTEIFAGDIVEDYTQHDIYRLHVVWNEADATFDFVEISSEETLHGSDIYLDRAKIIGNIHDNPELWR